MNKLDSRAFLVLEEEQQIAIANSIELAEQIVQIYNVGIEKELKEITFEEIKEICVKLDTHIYENGEVWRSYYADEVVIEDEEQIFHNKCLEMCVERCLAEKINLDGWEIFEVSYWDEEVRVLRFINQKKEKCLGFHVFHENLKAKYAVPYRTEEVMGEYINLLVNTAKQAIMTWK